MRLVHILNHIAGGNLRNPYTASQCSESCPMHPTEVLRCRRVSHCALRHLADGQFCLLCFVWVRLFGLLLCLVCRSLTGFCPLVEVVVESVAVDLGQLNLPCERISWFHYVSFISHVSPAAKGFVGFVVFCFFCLVFFVFFGLFAWVLFGFFFGFVSFPLLLARLSSFTDWCTAHRQQFFSRANEKKEKQTQKNTIWKTRF